MRVREAFLICVATMSSAAFGCGAPTARVTTPALPALPPLPRPVDAHTHTSATGEEARAGGERSERQPEEHWYFEGLSHDGKRALLRQLDPSSRATFHVRVIDVDGGHLVEDMRLPELAKIPSSTIGGKQAELTELEWMLASPSFSRDLVKGARIASGFPFGACGRLAASNNASAIAFDAGDWLYTADTVGRVRRRLVDEAAYDPRFSTDGKHFLFRRATGTDGPFAKYELFTMPADLSTPPRVIPGTAGVRDRFFAHPDGQSAIAITTQTRMTTAAATAAAGNTTATTRVGGVGAKGAATDTCMLSLSLKSPFLVKKLACLDGGEQLVEAVVSPRGKWVALSTKKKVPESILPARVVAEAPTYDRRVSSSPAYGGSGHVEWRLRVLSLATPGGKVVRDEPDAPGLGLRAISDTGLLVQSGALGILVTDVPAKKWRAVDKPIDLGHRGFFRNDKELVYVADGSVAVIDVSKD